MAEGLASSKFLSSSIELVAKLTSVFIFFSYVSIRTHYNYLGISSLVIPDTNTYLAEFWGIFVNTIFPLAQLLALLLLIVFPVYWLVSRFTKKGRFAINFDRLPHVLVYFLLLWNAFLFFSFTADWQVSDAVVGQLNTDKLVRNTNVQIAYYIQVALIVAGIFLIGLNRGRPTWKKYSLYWNLFFGMIIFLTINLPIIYGRFVKEPSFPQATIQTAKATHCGLLIEETGEAYTLWYALEGRGMISRVPKSQVIQIETGLMFNLIDVAIDDIHHKSILCTK